MARSAGRTRPVIKDVAKLAGVSAPTVSRYLNGTVNVTEDKRERIAKAIKGLGYEPSIVARALSNREMDSVVVFAANPSAFSTSETNHGVEAAARKRRFLLNIVSLDESDMDSVKARVRMGLSIRPAGVIVYEYDRGRHRRTGIHSQRYADGRGGWQLRRRRIPGHQRRKGWRPLDDHASAGSRPSHRVPCGASGRSDR